MSAAPAYVPPQKRRGSDRLDAGKLAGHIGAAAAMIGEACALDATADDLRAMASIAGQLQKDAEALARALRHAARQAGAHIVKSPKV